MLHGAGSKAGRGGSQPREGETAGGGAANEWEERWQKREGGERGRMRRIDFEVWWYFVKRGW